jgi:hypothetical protein
MMVAIEIGVSVFYAFATIVVGWTGIALLLCGLLGALARLRLDRESVSFLGRIAVGAIMLVDAVAIGYEIRQEVLAGGDDPLSPYLIVVMPVIAWLIHVPLGICALRLGMKGAEIVVTRAARTRGHGPNLHA